MLMLLIPLLLLVLLLLPLLHLCIGLPSFFPMQHHIALHIHGIRYFGQTIIPTARTELNFILNNIIIFPTEITLPDESTNGGYDPAVKRDELDAHVGGDILDGEISADKGYGEGLLFLLLVLLWLPLYHISVILIIYWQLFLLLLLHIRRVNLRHLLTIVIWCNPSLLVLNITILRLLHLLVVRWHCDPSFLVFKRLLGALAILLRRTVLLLLLGDLLLLVLDNFLNYRQWLLAQLIAQALLLI